MKADAGPQAGSRFSVPRLENDQRCFACGPLNADGLQLRFEYGADRARCLFVPSRRYAGWAGVLHGGILATLLDEAMAHAAIAAGVPAVTARMEIRFKKAAPIDAPLVLEGKLEARRSRMLELSATVAGEDGTVYAKGRGRFVPTT